ncbi:MAG: tetraacyldisaccharide 4'-kinase [Gemmatimonadota bacterium]|nr:tetraacyldisaccharide 4'-kinase [Gemmatimonadota bacterium]MDH3368760.1 tetraacyldisaccharide 4'-kinase [Gemmatimonadota bacterium]MDH3477108.1 tetraacyldisaccharide 4'-kinase [Gemmatimonadota bacterium]MDH3570944.1 tetraacyldisaccharide 4'-kinase [Gemmatimonadota bacterium]
MTRLALLPPSVLYRFVASLRARAYGSRLLPVAIPAVPTIAVGNLTVGGSGKTPLSSWIARYYADRGLRSAIVLRGYGGDEGEVHRRHLPQVIVVENPDRLAAARTAVARGAQVIVMDDAYQRLDVGRDLNIAVVSAESSRAVRWTLPAGPWREGWPALRRADLVVVTRKWASLDAALGTAQHAHQVAPHAKFAVAHLGLSGFRKLLSDTPVTLGALNGARVVAGAGIADPDAFARQCRAIGAHVHLVPFSDHHRYGERDIRRLLHGRQAVDYVVVTEKDAVKLRQRWPADAPEPLVAQLGLEWDRGEATVETALDAAVGELTGLWNPDPNRGGGTTADLR